MKFARYTVFASAIAALICSAANAATVTPYTETFSTSNASWTQNDSTAAAWIASGGPGGAADSFITTTYTVPTTTSSTPVIARATGTANASNGRFAGDYSSVQTISFSIKIDPTTSGQTLPDLPVGIRLNKGSGAAMVLDGGFVTPGQWTTVSIPLSTASVISYEGTPGATDADKFATVLASVADFQFFLYLGKTGYTAPTAATSATFSIDNVAVPEPASLALLSVGGAALLRRRRARA